MIKKYEQSILAIIQTYEDTSKICSKLGLCSTNDFLVKLTKNERVKREVEDKNLGTKPCTWGIEYWCVDDKTADECKVICMNNQLCVLKSFPLKKLTYFLIEKGH